MITARKDEQLVSALAALSGEMDGEFSAAVAAHWKTLERKTIAERSLAARLKAPNATPLPQLVETAAKVGAAPKPIVGERACALAECEMIFRLRSINSEERFCCQAHRTLYWHQAAQLGDRILRGGISVSGKSQKQCVLELLQEFAGRWVDRPLQRIPFVNWNVVSRLRRKGHRIECRMVWRSEQKKREYQYRLVTGGKA